MVINCVLNTLLRDTLMAKDFGYQNNNQQNLKSSRVENKKHVNSML